MTEQGAVMGGGIYKTALEAAAAAISFVDISKFLLRLIPPDDVANGWRFEVIIDDE